MDRVLDMGCGIGGPLRGVVRATGANVTGLTINAHQVRRAEQITAKLTPYMRVRAKHLCARIGLRAKRSYAGNVRARS
eukprot:5340995-Pleurochrysis_carterae.AAC.1